LSAVDKVQGGSPWGASTVSSGDGSLQPTENDLAIAEYQGKVSLKLKAQSELDR
jgi:NAD(P)H dehydrogenase (quinone)